MVPASANTWPCSRCSVPSDDEFRPHARRQRQVDVEIAFVDAQRQQDVLGRHMARFDADRAHAVAERPHRRAEHPGPVRLVRRQAEDHAALLGPGQADVDLAEGPALAVALIVDDEIAVLEAELAQIVTVEAGRAEAVDPAKNAGDVLRAGAHRPGRRHAGRLARAGGTGNFAEAVAIGRLLAPANTVTRPSVSMRTDISAPTRLRLSARTLPVSRLVPEMPTSAFGALATMVPSASRTTMSRKRNDVRPFSSRSIWVPPTDTVCLPPKFCSIAAFSHGVATSSSIGPLERRHHSAADGEPRRRRR